MADKFPAGWKLLPLEDCMAAIIDYRGITPQKSSFGVPLVTAKIVKGGRLLDVNEYIPAEDYDDWMRRGLPEPGDVVMTTEAPLGEIAQLDSRQVALAQRLITLRGKPGLLDNTFLKFLMMSDFVQNQLKARSTGTTVLGIKQSELRKVTLVVPPLNEQRAIAHIMGTLDEKILLNQRINKVLEVMARAIFKAWFVDYDPVNAKAEGRQPAGMDAETAILFPDSFEGDKPIGWKKGGILEIANLLSGGTPKTSEPEYWDGGIPWVSAKDVGNTDSVFLLETEKTISNAGLENSSTKLLPARSTIVTARGTVGAYCMLGRAMTMNQTNYGLLAKEGIGDYFIYFTLSNLVEQLKQQSYGTIFDTITTRTFQNTLCVHPPLAILGKFEEQVMPLMDAILNNQQQSGNLAVLRDALLPKLMIGEIKIDDPEQFLGAGV